MMIFQICLLSIKQGNDPIFSSVGYAGIASILCCIGDFDIAYKIGEISIELQNKMGTKESKGRIFFCLISG